MDENKSKVYIKIDSKNRIIRCEGGYTMSNIDDISEWILIDEGTGDKYNLCQSNYFDPPLYTEDGIPRWKYVEGQTMLRSAEEIEADRAAIPAPTPTLDVWDELDAAYQAGYNEGYAEGVNSVYDE